MPVSLPAILVLLLISCGNPDEVYFLPGEDGPSGGGGPQPGASGGAAGPGAGNAVASPPLTGSLTCGSATASSAPDADDTVKITGSLDYEGDTGARILLEVIHSKDGEVRTAANLICRDLGPLEVELPSSLGTVRLVAVIDVDGSGPSEGDPMGMSEDLDLGAGEPLEGVAISIVADADLGDYAPYNISLPPMDVSAVESPPEAHTGPDGGMTPPPDALAPGPIDGSPPPQLGGQGAPPPQPGEPADQAPAPSEEVGGGL